MSGLSGLNGLSGLIGLTGSTGTMSGLSGHNGLNGRNGLIGLNGSIGTMRMSSHKRQHLREQRTAYQNCGRSAGMASAIHGQPRVRKKPRIARATCE